MGKNLNQITLGVATIKAKCRYGEETKTFIHRYGFQFPKLTKKKREYLKNQLKPIYETWLKQNILIGENASPSKISISCSLECLTCEEVI